MIICRAKFEVETLTIHKEGETIKMKAVGYDGSDENAAFTKFTPSGSFEMFVTNETLFGLFAPGESYYFDISPA